MCPVSRAIHSPCGLVQLMITPGSQILGQSGQNNLWTLDNPCIRSIRCDIPDLLCGRVRAIETKAGSALLLTYIIILRTQGVFEGTC